MIQIQNKIALVTGANRGLGLAFVQELLDKGAIKVYATSRQPHDFGDGRVVNIILDVKDAASIKRLNELVPDVDILISNAGVFLQTSILGTDIEKTRDEFETNVLGPIEVAQVMARILKNNGGGAIIEVLSVASWLPFGTYGATKAALWSVTNSLRQELKGQNTHVLGLHVGPIDTDMVRELDMPKHDPRDVAKAALNGLESGQSEVVFDDFSQATKQSLSGPVEKLAFTL